MITVDLAHRLSLIARNLEQAQTCLDSAFELLQTIIESSEVQSPTAQESPQSETPPHPGGHLRKSDANKRLKPVKAGERREGIAVHSWIIKRFIEAHHSKPFNNDEIIEFAKSLGYLADRKQILNTLYRLTSQKEFTRDSQGLWKPIAKA
jgi:hypothetical protein